MKIKTLAIITLSALFAMTACNNQNGNKTANVAEEKTEITTRVEKPVISTLPFDTMAAKTIQNFKGGEGELYMKMFTEGEIKVMYCTVPSGSSVGYHTHDTNFEVIYVLSGTATVFFDHNEQIYTKGMAHYCPKGHGHSIHNFGDEDLVIYNVIALP